MYQVGRLFVCDRCKKTIFEESTIERIKIEALTACPQSWRSVDVLDGRIMLCGDCLIEYEKIREKHLNELKGFIKIGE